MERRIHAASTDGPAPVLIRFEIGGPVPDDAARQVGARVASQFRYNDLVCRWSEREFLVLFQGPFEVAQVRSGQVAPWVAGRYLLDNGEIAEIRIAYVQAVQGLEGLNALPSTATEPAVSPA
jgi:GGDEF domain-containing protein